ncbi:YafY family transcriptional regulator [Ktedonosporobacter rubrisoli]|uniref:YafY family transcriptional regulator n=1 Tax=Ktedonosporobacter rubrisoli TaxID=2509675 RepID=A0A4P6K045_KTERU|nr:YafY family protein [Ktedonosporobacter rubrisoli]QBD81487.1 YafY family transcriptional regulator [Ktedonosporobacter rubrisoli]
MYFPTTRVLTVLELLQSHQRLSGPELAERLEVNTRTIRRYVTMLQDLGIPVEAERGRYGSYRLRPGFKLPPLMFNDEEALALTLGLLAARRLGLATAAPAVEGAIAKIERVLPLTLKEQVRAIQETLVFDVRPAQARPRSGIVSLFSTASAQYRQVLLCYQPWQSEVSERIVDPYGLVYRSGFWYTAGYCHLRQDLRTFRLDRVVHAEMLEDTFTPQPEFDCLSFVQQSIARTPSTWLVEVLLETTLENAQSMIPPSLAVLEQEGEKVKFYCYVDNVDWMARVLIRLSCPFIVRQPEELRDALRRLAAQIVAQAERTE